MALCTGMPSSQPAAPRPSQNLFRATSSLKPPGEPLHFQPNLSQCRGVSSQNPQGSHSLLSRPHFSPYFGYNYMFTDLFPITSLSESQHPLNKSSRETYS